MESDDDETPVLSGNALAALQEFYTDRDARDKQFTALQEAAREESPPPLTMDAFAEDWNESQFWYADETAILIASELLRGAHAGTVIAVVSAPSVFVAVRNLLAKSGKEKSEWPRLWLLEYDRRFGVFPEFVLYDFNKPMELPLSMKGSVDRIICDPPFLSEDCQTRAAMTVRWLSKSWGVEESDQKLILCTGERMETLVTKLYRAQGLATTDYEPRHSNGLSNEFLCYANYECEHWKWK